MQQIAKLFASLGFQIDTAQLSKFESLMKGAQGTMSAFARDVGSANIKLKTLMSRMDAVDAKFDKKSAGAATGNLHRSVNKYIDAFNRLIREEPKIGGMMERVGIKSNRLANRLDNGTASWTRYADAVKRARDKMKEVTAEMERRRSVSPPSGTGAPRGGNGNNGGSGGGNRGGGSGYGGGNSGDGGSMFFGGIPKFSKAFVGQMALGGALGSGYAVKELITAGREVQKMEQMLLQASANTQDFNNNLSFTRTSADQLAVSFTEFGTAYSKILNATERTNLTQQQKQDTVFGFAKYMRTINLNDADQAGVFRQLGQMFNTGRIQQDEINSMADRGIALNKFLRMAAESVGISSDAYTKLQEAGKADPVKLIPIVAKLLSEAAEKNGAYAKSLETSLAKQQLFTNAMKDFAAKITKVLDPALAKMFNGLAKLIEAVTPIFVSLSMAISGLALMLNAIFSMNWKQWGLTVVVILGSIYTWMVAIFGWTIGTKIAMEGLRMAMIALGKAVPLVAFVALLHVMGQIKQWYTDMENGVIRYNWIDVLGADFQLFFSEVGLGWAEMNLSITRVIATAKALLELDWDKVNKIWNGGSPESQRMGVGGKLVSQIYNGTVGSVVDSFQSGAMLMDRLLGIAPKVASPNAERPITINIEVDGKTISQKAVMRPDGSYYVPPRP